MGSLRLGSLLKAGTKVLVDTGEHLVGGLADALVSVAQVDGDVVDKGVLLTGLATQDLPETVGLDVVLRCDGELLGDDGARPLLVFLASLDGLVLVGAEGRWVIGVGAVVAVYVHVAVTLPGGEGPHGAVDGDLFVVAAETVTVGVGVGEETGLQHWVGGRLDTGDHVRGRESRLLDLGEVVLGVLVEGELAEATQGHLSLGPDLGQVEDVPAELLSLLRAQGLDVDGPRGVLAALDGVEQVLGVPVGVLRSQTAGLLIVHGFAALISLQVDLDVVESAVRLDPLVGVARVAVHMAERVGGTTITEEMHDLVNSLMVSREVVPEHGGILQVGLGVTLLGVDEDRELGRVAKEENRSVVEHPVPVTLIGVELDGEATGIASAVRRTFLATDGRETGETLGLLANGLEHINDCDVADIVGDLELSIGASTLGVNDTLWDSLPVKVCQKVNQVEVLKQQRAVTANALCGLRVEDRTAIGGGVNRLLVVAVGSCKEGVD